MNITRVDSGTSSVLVIDNDPLMLTAMGAVLNMQGHRAVLARNEDMAMQSIVAGQFDVIILSVEQLQAGCDFAAKLRAPAIARDIPIIFLVPELSNAWLTKLAAHGGVFCILKPIDPAALIDLVEKVLWLPHVAKGRLGTAKEHLSHQNDWVKLA